MQFRTTGDDILFSIIPGLVQAQSLAYNYHFYSNAPDLTGVRAGNFVSTPIPNGITVLPGQDIRIFDNAVVDSTADDMVIHFHVLERQQATT